MFCSHASEEYLLSDLARMSVDVSSSPPPRFRKNNKLIVGLALFCGLKVQSVHFFPSQSHYIPQLPLLA